VTPRPREHVARLEPYEWEAMASDVAAAAGIAESEVVRFDTNTTPWPPVAWEQIVLDMPRAPANEYPHPSNEPLRSALARHLGVDVDQQWDLPREPLLEAVRDPQVGVVWLCSPNNPTGRLLSAELVGEVAEAAPQALICVDEAYYEVAGQSVLGLQQANVAVVRTFSKGYGLAGARVGYLVAHAAVARAIDTLRLPQNLTVFSISAACRALADQPGLAQRVASIKAERQRLSEALEQQGWGLVPSTGNFLLGRPPSRADQVARWLQGAGLIVRSYPTHPRLKDWLRITVRSPEEDDRLLARLRTFA
jgi:histidinol-phosphate aminotransferase